MIKSKLSYLLILPIILFIMSLTPKQAIASLATQNIKVVHVCKKEDTTENILACNIYKEARGEGYAGMLAVGFVTLNRQGNNKFPHTIKKVVYQPKQFSWTSSHKNQKIYEEKAWEQSKLWAAILLRLHKYNRPAYILIDFTDNSLYYHSKHVKPSWRHALLKTITVGNHILYKEKNNG